MRAYAYLLLAFAEGVTPFGGDGPSGPTLGDDPNEFEIVQFGIQFSDEQRVAGEKLAARLIGAQAISSTGAVGPTGIADAIKELQPRREAYRFKGRLATLRFPGGASALVAGMRRAGGDRMLAQAVSELNDVGVPHELLYIEAKMKERGGAAAVSAISRARSRRRRRRARRFAWLSPGVEVRIVKYHVNDGFASQVAPTGGSGAEAGPDAYWIDSCLIEFADAEGQAASGRRAFGLSLKAAPSGRAHGCGLLPGPAMSRCVPAAAREL